MSISGWIGVDLDGTLATYDGWQGAAHIGAPLPAMLKRVQQWLAQGIEVRIFTARVSHDPDGAAAAAITAWLVQHGLPADMKITCTKDYAMVLLVDDRCVRAEFNTGTFCPGCAKAHGHDA